MTLTARGKDWAVTLLLAGIVTAVWCISYHRLSWRDWRVPLAATSDAITVLAGEKAAAEGHFLPFVEKFNPHLGAPFVANWNDWPVTEEFLLVIAGLISHAIGLFTTANLLVLAAQVLATAAFYLTCRALRYRRHWSAVAAFAFGLSHYAFQRGLPHLLLTFYWHIPLCILVTWWCGSKRGLRLGSRRFWFATAIALVTGLQNPYYTNGFIQLLGFSTVAQLLRRNDWRRAVTPIVLGAFAFAAFLSMNLDTIVYQKQHGANGEAAARNYRAVELYALKPIDFVVPPPNHRSSIARQFAFNYVYDEGRKAYVQGELFSPYLGLIGIIGCVWMAGSYTVATILRRPTALPVEAAQSLWLLLYSIVGGVNGLIGFAGIMLFRCTDRYSIFILALALLFLAKKLSRRTRSWPVTASAGVTALGFAMIYWDQVPPLVTRDAIDASERAIASDRAFVARMEHRLNRGAMVFQLPVMRFPESWPINEMGDYEHLRPYLYSRTLHYSYGSDKGRTDDEWQGRVERLPPAEMAAALEKMGFSAIYINRKGYADRAASLLNGLSSAGYNSVIYSPMGDLACVILQPSPHPVLPETPFRFTKGWYSEEGDATGNTWRCSSGNAEVTLINASQVIRKFQISFQLASYSPRTVEIRYRGKPVYKSPPLTPAKASDWFAVEVPPGETTLEFYTQPAVRFPASADKRLLGFVLYNFTVVEQR